MVVKVLKIRDDSRQAQQAAWVSDISNVDKNVNDASPF
jgi:conjugal transfer/entry exclusion protein